MNVHGLAEMLAEDYAGAPPRRIALTVVLFGLRHADALRGVPLTELVQRAVVPPTYVEKLRLGMMLSDHVDLRAELF